MDLILDAWRTTDLPRDTVVTIGNYDGVHLGQQAVIGEVVRTARTSGRTSTLVTFDPHPLSVLRPDSAPLLLDTPEQKRRAIAALGIDAMLVLRFDRELAKIDAEGFVEEFLVARLGLRALFVGRDFRFGAERRGSVPLLRELGKRHGFEMRGVEEIEYRGEPISATRIRTALLDGEVEDAERMLGRAYEIEGRVVRGDRMGQRLGWPTVNVAPENELYPADGVYATQIRFTDLDATFDSVTNVGTRPTVYEHYQRVIESHVLDFDNDVYDRGVAVSFFKRLREERIFPTIMDLSAQIGRDAESSREYFVRRRRAEERDGCGTDFPA